MAKRTMTVKHQQDTLHVEAPGCAIHIRMEGPAATAIEILPDRDRYPGEVWLLADDRRAVAMHVRVVRTRPRKAAR